MWTPAHERVSRTRLGPNTTTPTGANDGYVDLIHFALSNPVSFALFACVDEQHIPQQVPCQVGTAGSDAFGALKLTETARGAFKDETEGDAGRGG